MNGLEKNLGQKQCPRTIPFDKFVDSRLNSLTWYDILPEDNILISGDADPRSAIEVADLLLDNNEIEDLMLIDLLTMKILNHCQSIKTYGRWSELSFSLSEVMSKSLNATGSRSLRMRAQRLVYCLQTIIDSERNTDYSHLIVDETILYGEKPWDYLLLSSGEWWLSSDENNFHCRCNNGDENHWNIGLPTQIDLQLDGRLAIGSLYTNGALLTDGEDWERIKHDAPIVLVFEFRGRRYLLDHSGSLWIDQPRRRIMKTRPQIHFARFFNDVVYILDNGDFGYLTTITMKNRVVQRHSVLPVQVCNDVLVTQDAYYLIDKQQGSVFKFNHNWCFEKRALLFGRAYGCLQDPVAIHLYDNYLVVISWLTARLTRLKVF